MITMIYASVYYFYFIQLFKYIYVRKIQVGLTRWTGTAVFGGVVEVVWKYMTVGSTM